MLLLGSFLEYASFALLVYGLAAASLRLITGKPKWEESATRAVHAATLTVSSVAVVLLAALIRGDFRLEYVAAYTSTTLPLVYRLTAFWAGQAGSLLLWLLLLLAFASLSLWLYRRKYPGVIAWFILFAGSTALFFNLLLLLFPSSNPLTMLGTPMIEGRGLNPQLQNAGMIFHPPTLYMGYVGFTIPFAMAMASLLSRSHWREWMKITRLWTLLSWVFLTVGIILGAQWAYVELGWGGYWAWDPVENASFIPWLAATAFLHTVIVQERRGMLKKWNTSLVVLTYLLCIFGTFVTRSGFIESVHAFGKSSIGYFFLAFMTATFIVAVITMILRWDLLKAEDKIEQFFSKEGAVILTNLLLLLFMLLITVGTVFPGVAEIFGLKVSVAPPFYNAAVAPFGVVLLTLLALCPLVGWRRSHLAESPLTVFPVIYATVGFGAAFLYGVISILLGMISPDQTMPSLGRWVVTGSLATLGVSVIMAVVGDFSRSVGIRRELTGEGVFTSLVNLIRKNKRRYGAQIVHLGVVSLCLGVAGSAYFSQEFEAKAEKGATFQAGAFSLCYSQFNIFTDAEKKVYQAVLKVSRGGRDVGVFKPETHVHHLFGEQPMREVAIRSSLVQDLYIIFTPLSTDGQAYFKVLVNPMVIWIWIGGGLMTLGGLLACLPGWRPAVLREIAGRVAS